jgi:hypothetical protein
MDIFPKISPGDRPQNRLKENAMDEIDVIMQRLNHGIRESFADGERRLPADEDRIAHFESAIGYKLPPDFRYFLTCYSGARIYNVFIPTPVVHERLWCPDELHLILCFGGFYSKPPQGPKSTADLLTRYHALEDVLPAGIVSFAEFVQQKYYFCISCFSETYGQVFLKAREEYGDDDPAELLFPYAPNFIELLRSLRTLSDEEADAID